MALHKQDCILFAPPVKNGVIGDVQAWQLRPQRRRKMTGNAPSVPLLVPQNQNRNGQRGALKSDELIRTHGKKNYAVNRLFSTNFTIITY